MSRPSRGIGVLIAAMSMFVFFVVIASPVAWAQTNSRPKFPLPSTLPAVMQEEIISYWTSETGWSSELQLRNNSLQDLTVTPSLRLADGTETALSAVTIKSQEVTSVYLDQAISAANASQLVGTYGSVVLRYFSPARASLYAAIMIRRPGHPIEFHVDASGEWQDFQAGSREGIWWLPNNTSSDYLILTNQGTNTIPVVLSIYDASGRANSQKLSLPSHQTLRYSLRNLVQAAGLAGSYGGIKVSTNSNAGSLDTLHFLFDENAGFSAILKMFDYNPKAKLEERDYAHTGQWTLRAPMLALSNPDPALGFPPGTTLQPQLFIRNTTANSINAALRFNWRTASTTGKATGPTLRLAPYQTAQVDVAAFQGAGTLPKAANWTSVTVVTNSLPDEVMAVAASYDSTLRYGVQTPFSDQLTFRWEGGMWEYDAYHDSIITAGNGGSQPINAAFRIFYNQGTKMYELDQALQPDDQMWIDVGNLIREQVPDKNGNTLPANLTSGSYEFRDLSHNGAGTLFEGKVIYDKMYGHAAYGCAACCGYGTNTQVWYNPLGIPDLSTAPQGVQAPDECQGGVASDVSDSFYGSWSTGSTAIATADYYGTHTGVAVGSTTSTTYGLINSNNARLFCPRFGSHPQGNTNVAKVSCSPSSVTRGNTTTCTATGPNGSTFSGWKFTDAGGNVVPSASTNSTWSGQMVTSGTVSVVVHTSDGGQTPTMAQVTVTNRNWHTNPPSPAEVPNGTFIVLPVPPQNTGTDSGLGFYKWQLTDNGGAGTTISDSGPNNGYYYYGSNLTFSAFYYQYEINPDLENSGSTFSQHQWGNCGYISWTNLITQTRRHEYNSAVQSHYAFYEGSLNSNNPGDYWESRVAPPGTNISTFDQATRNGINADYTAIGNATAVQPYPVNYSETGVSLGTINYAPYAPCN